MSFHMLSGTNTGQSVFKLNYATKMGENLHFCYGSHVTVMCGVTTHGFWPTMHDMKKVDLQEIKQFLNNEKPPG